MPYGESSSACLSRTGRIIASYVLHKPETNTQDKRRGKQRKVRELDVLAFLLAVFGKVPVEIRSVFLAGFALEATFLMSTRDKLPLIVSSIAGDK